MLDKFITYYNGYDINTQYFNGKISKSLAKHKLAVRQTAVKFYLISAVLTPLAYIMATH